MYRDLNRLRKAGRTKNLHTTGCRKNPGRTERPPGALFGQYNLDLSVEKHRCEQEMPALRERIGILQCTFHELGIPVIIVFEGWHTSGISRTINRLTYALDPRGYRLHYIQEPSDLERAHPLIWRFWCLAPARGQIAIFDRSWYSRVVMEHFNPDKDPPLPDRFIDDITAMEDQMADDGTLILRFFLHIDRKEQKKRLRKIEEKHPEILPDSPGMRRNQEGYDHLLPYIENMLIKTNRASRPWTIVEATDHHYAVMKVYRTVIRAMEEEIARRNDEPEASGRPPSPGSPDPDYPQERSSVLARTDLNRFLSEEEYRTRLAECQKRLGELQFRIHSRNVPVILVFEGWDAAGKGGAIIRLSQAFNSRCSVVEPVCAPCQSERDRHYLWRFYRCFPRNGAIAIFDRSWYGRVLVERVEGFCTCDEWRRAYDEINVMEQSLVRNGALLQKFWLHIDKATQLARFRERETNPRKKYKITPDDWRNREKWDLYEEAVNDMFQKTSSPWAPWTVVESNDKYYSRITVLETIVRGIEDRLKEGGGP
ncbi:MAG: polyphosphate:AMP phosphotransferase [Methanoregulaceae archaeon]